MSEKIFNGRIVQKHDTEANWNKAINFVPKAGELIVYTDLNKMKIGNGVDTVIDLPFTGGESGFIPEISVDGHSLIITTTPPVHAPLLMSMPNFSPDGLINDLEPSIEDEGRSTDMEPMPEETPEEEPIPEEEPTPEEEPAPVPEEEPTPEEEPELEDDEDDFDDDEDLDDDFYDDDEDEE